MGERPAILTRGYARTPAGGRRGRRPRSGRHPQRPHARRRRAADARAALPACRCSSSSDRYLAGRLAEHALGATVHVLDDGFQHLQLDRDIDLVLVGRDGSGRNPVTLPGGPAARTARHVDRGRRRAGGRRRRAVAGTAASNGRSRSLPPHPATSVRTPRGRRRRPVVRRGRHRPAGWFFDDLRAGGLRARRHAGVSRSPPYSRTRRQADCEAGATARARRRRDHGKGLRAAAAVAAFSAAGRVRAAYNGARSAAEFRQWLAGSLRAARDIVD